MRVSRYGILFSKYYNAMLQCGENDKEISGINIESDI